MLVLYKAGKSCPSYVQVRLIQNASLGQGCYFKRNKNSIWKSNRLVTDIVILKLLWLQLSLKLVSLRLLGYIPKKMVCVFIFIECSWAPESVLNEFDGFEHQFYCYNLLEVRTWLSISDFQNSTCELARSFVKSCSQSSSTCWMIVSP